MMSLYGERGGIAIDAFIPPLLKCGLAEYEALQAKIIRAPLKS
ncbi:hypothetical protein [Sphingobium cloacae]|nr:hypothetical protein [Sphingobium cloacae]